MMQQQQEQNSEFNRTVSLNENGEFKPEDIGEFHNLKSPNQSNNGSISFNYNQQNGNNQQQQSQVKNNIDNNGGILTQNNGSTLQQQQQQQQLNQNQQKQEPQQQLQQQDDYIPDLDETIGFEGILDEDERAPTDINKNIPRISKYQEAQFSKFGVQNPEQMAKVVNFCRYQFPDFFEQKSIMYKNNNHDKNHQKNGNYPSKSKSNNNNVNENDSNENSMIQHQQNTSEERSQDEEVLLDVIKTIIDIANPEHQENNNNNGNDQALNDTLTNNQKDDDKSHLKDAFSPKTIHGYQGLNRSSFKSSQQIPLGNGAEPSPEKRKTKTIQITTVPTSELGISLNNNKKQLFQEYLIEIFNAWIKTMPAPLVPAKDVIFQYNIPEIEYSKITDKAAIHQLVKNFKYIDQEEADPKKSKKDKKKDERASSAYKDGGKRCVNEEIISILRATGKEMISKIGRELLSGDFNLTKLSFPIRVMIPISGLEKALNSTCLFPIYMNRAAYVKDPVERMKLVMTASLGHFFINLSFLKPLNPILGETCEATYPDGTTLYAEQISHHPPISYFTVYGPDKSYKFWGYYHFSSNAGLNSLTLKNIGKRYIQFKDGQLIEYNFGKEKYTGSFWGTMRTEAEGKMEFKDEKNKLSAKIEFDKGDYIKGGIKRNPGEKSEQKIVQIGGSYMGFIEFDGIRYWDFKHTIAFKPQLTTTGLGSDQAFRQDKIYLGLGHIETAQEKKEELEILQRQDAALRKESAKERELKLKQQIKQDKKDIKNEKKKK